MYFLIGRWGHGDARASALKFFLYTLAGSLAMLLGDHRPVPGDAIRSPSTCASSSRAQPLAGTDLRAGAGAARLRRRLRDQDAAVPGAHLAAAGARRRARAGLGDPRRRAAEDGRLRADPHPAVDDARHLRALRARRWRSSRWSRSSTARSSRSASPTSSGASPTPRSTTWATRCSASPPPARWRGGDDGRASARAHRRDGRDGRPRADHRRAVPDRRLVLAAHRGLRPSTPTAAWRRSRRG